MGTTYTWHPGSHPVKGHWAVPLPLLPDEAFSGWLVRAALTLGCDPLVLTGALWPKWRVWTMDCDLGIPEDRLAVLEQESGIAAASFRSSQLCSLMPHILGHVPKKTESWPWVRRFGRRNRRCVQGWQYCPACFEEDEAPFMRVQWRWAWQVACEKHGVLLQEQCPHCGGPVMPHRLTAVDEHLARCALCSGDLREVAVEPADDAVLDMQRICDGAAVTGKVCRGEHEVDSSDWFDLAHFFTGLVRRCDLDMNRRVVQLLTPDAGELGRLELPLALESQPLKERVRLMVPAIRMASVSAKKLLVAARKAGLSSQSLKIRNRLPHLLEPIMDELPTVRRSRRKPYQEGRKGPRPKATVERMWRRLQRKAGLS